MKLKRNILIALVLLFSSLYTVGQTLAAPYYATYYTSAGNRIAFMLDGTAQSGGDIVQVNNILTSPTFNGTAANIPSATLQSWSNFLFSDNTTPALSFSGNTLNFFWGDPNIAANEAIIFDDSTLTAFGAPIFAGGASFGNVLEPFVAGNWSLRPVLTFNAAYETLSGDVIAFMFDGVIENNGDTVEVIQLSTPPTFNGLVSNIAGATLQSWSDFLFGDDTIPSLSFSGNMLNFFWGDPNIAANEAIIFDDSTLTAFGAPIFAGGASFGNTLEAFNANNWSLTQYNRIPEPATNMLIMLGMAGLFLLRRRYL